MFHIPVIVMARFANCYAMKTFKIDRQTFITASPIGVERA